MVEDEGLGLPEGFDLKRKDTLGFQLVYGLVEQQLHGSVSFESRKGLRCVVRFTEPEVRGRN